MLKKSEGAVRAKIDPSLPFTEVEVGGRKLKMCLDFGALAEAEAALNAQGADVALLSCLPRLSQMNNLLTVFACSLGHYHPEITLAEAKRLPTILEQYEIMQVIKTLWVDSTPDAEVKGGNGNPPQPEA